MSNPNNSTSQPDRRNDDDGDFMAAHFLLAVANDRDARDGSGEAVRPVPRIGPVCLRGEARVLDRGPTAVDCSGGFQLGANGHRREVVEEGLRARLTVGRPPQVDLLHPRVLFHPARPLPDSQLSLAQARLLPRRAHVAQVYGMPVFDTLEGYLVKNRKFDPSRALRLIARSVYVALTALVAMCIPFFGGLMGFFGGLVFASTSYFLPCIMWLRVHHPPVGSWHWFASWVTIVVGVTIAILAPIGGMRNIIESAKTYKFFS
ncbi:unnamed protein product [Linum trigynum]|uniref:Amino acid transporter transmembrane domain-containing protein n=1 Tax=Linum trigynum TaxID=586398 RepID=A0AAV2FHZ1_9ROSI